MPDTTPPPDPDPRVQAAVQQEREACMQIVEACYLQISHGHGANADTMVREILRRIAAREAPPS